MSKKLNEDAIMSELSGSKFFPPSPTLPRETGGNAQNPNGRTVEPINRTVTTHEVSNEDLIAEIQVGSKPEKRLTERYSFEIFTDQRERIEDVQYTYKKRLGRKISASRIIRTAIDEYLNKLDKALKE